MSGLQKARDIIELGLLLHNSFRGLCIEDIQDHFECSRRTAERMKSRLFELFPDKIEEVPTNDKRKRWRFTKEPVNTLVSFSAADFANLEYLKELSNDENRQKQTEDLILKIKSLTPKKSARTLDNDLEAILESEGYAIRQYPRFYTDPENLKLLRTAMIAFKKIKFTYTAENKTFEVTVNPYGIIIANKYFLLAYADYAEDFRLYRVDRIKDLTVTDEYFDKDENFSLKEFCKNSFGIYREDPINVELEFDKSAAEDVLNYHFHPSQEIKQMKNGNVKVKFTSGGTLAMCWELFKWGDKVKIVKPKKFKTFYKDYILDVLKTL